MRFYAQIERGQKAQQRFAMKTKWQLFILFIFILSFENLSSAKKTDRSQYTKGNKYKLSVMKLKRKPSQRVSGSTAQFSWSGSSHTATQVTPSVGPSDPETRTQSDFAYVPDVSVTCSASDLVVRVKPAFYGLGADAQELTLGGSCKSNGVLKPQGDLLFTYPLTACDGKRELPYGYLVYKHVLHYEPSPKRFPSKAHQIDVNIECHYQRDHSVHQLAVQPTWETVLMRKKLKGRAMDFHIKLMDDSWSSPAKSQVYLLGQAVNVQVSAPHLPPSLKLYISSCYATPSNGSKSSLRYTMIDNFGCMMDSKHYPGASQFISRTGNILRFSLRAFQFTADPEMEITVDCKLSITSEDPGPVHKSCTYQDQRWRALTGRDSICECCETTCVTTKSRRAPTEGFARSEPLLVSDQSYTAEDDFKSISSSGVSSGEDDKINIYTDLISQQNLWERLDVEDYDGRNKQQLEGSEAVLGLTESDLYDLKYRILEEPEMENLEDIWMDELVKQEKMISEHAEGSEDEITEVQIIYDNQEKNDLLHSKMQLEQISAVDLQRELEPTDAVKGKEKTCEGEKERERMNLKAKQNDSLVAEEEETWYFKWK